MDGATTGTVPSGGSPGRVVVVTGGAGGIGQSVVETFARTGDTVAVVDLEASHIADTVKRLQGLPGPVSGFVADVSSLGSVDGAVAKIRSELGSIDVLVNGAAVILRKDVLDVGEQEWRRVLDVNLSGTFFMSQSCARMMGPGSSIVNIGSINAERLNPDIVGYGVSKAAVAALTSGMAVALAPQGIRVNGIVGGHVLTDFSRRRLENPVERDKVLRSIPLGRLGRAEDFANAIHFLASEEASWITGVMLPVEGGWLSLDSTSVSGSALG